MSGHIPNCSVSLGGVSCTCGHERMAIARTPGPDDSLPIPDIEDTAALPAGLVYRPGTLGGVVLAADQHIPGVGIKHAQAVYKLGEESQHERAEKAKVLYRAFADALAMSHDAGSIGQPENITVMRGIWDGWDEMRQDSVLEKIGELLTEYHRAGPAGVKGGAVAQIERVINALLDG